MFWKFFFLFFFFQLNLICFSFVGCHENIAASWHFGTTHFCWSKGTRCSGLTCSVLIIKGHRFEAPLKKNGEMRIFDPCLEIFKKYSHPPILTCLEDFPVQTFFTSIFSSLSFSLSFFLSSSGSSSFGEWYCFCCC